ncbi:DEAD/DEAH box helicase [Azotobacter salinestris]|uniref:DEAD/DEAH box helicase n=1 Tax=Azotobacter salinestris TaxID=69964 RepID=UPI001266E1C0|nr:DEAD/DEAH box helicase [Azotobacter salinestris]
MTFASLGLIEPLLRTLPVLGYILPTPVQRQAIPALLAGRDLLVAAQTGSGKTAGFALPVLQRLTLEGPPVAANSVRALVLVPTRELAEQVHGSIRACGMELPLRTAVAYGGVSINPQMMMLRPGLDVLVATPGRLLDLYRQNAVRFDRLQILVLDEADRMLDLGFARELDELFALLPRQRQTLLCSATFSEEIRQIATGLLRDPLTIEISAPNSAAPSVDQWMIPVDKKLKVELFLHLLERERWEQVLVFSRTRKGVERLAEELQQRGYRAGAIHGDLPQPARLRALEQFKAGELQVLVATDVASRGLDIQGLPLVVNLDLPVAPEYYVHRIGRTGRAGASGEAISLVCADEVEQLAAIEALIRQLLPRREEPDFSPEHRVPETALGGAILKKPKKPKQKPIPGAAGNSRIHLGNLLDDKARPAVEAVRQMPNLSAPPGKKK